MGLRVPTVLLLLLAGCLSATEPVSDPAPETDDPPLVRLNGELLTLGQFEQFMEFASARHAQRAPAVDLVGEFVGQRLLLQAARESSTEVTENEVDAFLAFRIEGEPQAAAGSTLRRAAHDFLLGQRFVQQRIAAEIELGLQDALNYYSEHEEDFHVGNRLRVLEILLETRSEAEQMRINLMDGDIRTFREMAARYSKGATAAAGGDLGYFEEGDLPPDFEKFIFALRPLQVSGVFASPHGYHLFLLEEWIPAHAQKFHEVQEEIFRLLRAQRERTAVANLMNQLLQSASIELYDKRYRVEDIRTAAAHAPGVEH